MNKRLLIFLTAVAMLCAISYVQGATASGERMLILREAKEYRDSTVAVEAHLTDNILEAKITAWMYATKPRIHNAIIVGPKLGRLSIEAKDVLLQSAEEDEPYPTGRKDRGFISFGKDKKEKYASGTLTRELMTFRIPRDRLKKDKKYQLWVQIESMQLGGKYKTFKFDLENLAELVSQ